MFLIFDYKLFEINLVTDYDLKKICPVVQIADWILIIILSWRKKFRSNYYACFSIQADDLDINGLKFSNSKKDI